MLRTAVEFKLSLWAVSCILFVVVFIRSFGGQKNQKPRHTESPVCLFFAQELPVATSLGQKGIASKFFLLVFGWCGTPSVSYRLQRHLTNSQTVLPLFPKTKRNLLVSFNGAGISWTLPLLIYSRQKAIRRQSETAIIPRPTASCLVPLGKGDNWNA